MDDLDDLIDAFIDENYNPHQQDELRNALALFNAFDYTPVHSKLNDIMMDTSRDDSDQTRMAFLDQILLGCQNLLSSHSLSLLDASELRIMNRLLATIYRIQAIDDPEPYLQILDTQFSNEEKFAKIVDALTDIDEGVVLMVLDTLPDAFITALRALLEDRSSQVANAQPVDPAQVAELDSLRRMLKLFYQCHGTDNLAYAMEDLGFTPGLSAGLYWPHVKDSLVGATPLATAKNLLGLFLFASDTCANPIQAYHRCSELIIPEPEQRMKIDTLLRDLFTTLQNTQKATDDAKRLSSV